MNLDAKEDLAVAAREDEGRVIHLKDAKGEPLFDGEKPVTVTVAGTYSNIYRQLVTKHRRQSFRRAARRGEDELGDVFEEQALELTAACVRAWDGVTLANGQPAPCEKEHVLKLLARPWFRQQIETAMGDHEAFFAGRSTS